MAPSTEHEDGNNIIEKSRTDLDSHANVVVLGKHSYIVNYTGKTAKVHPFSPEHEALKVPIVDAVIQYIDPYSG